MSDSQQGRLVRELEGASVRQEWGTVRENAVRLDSGDAAEVVEALNAVHAGAFNLFYLARKHYWTAEGAEAREVADFLKGVYGRLRATNDDVAERINELGGVPASAPPDIQAYATVRLEAEHLYSLRASLEGELEAHATLAACVRDAIEVADAAGDEATRELLQERLEEIEDDAATIEDYLADDTLVR